MAVDLVRCLEGKELVVSAVGARFLPGFSLLPAVNLFFLSFISAKCRSDMKCVAKMLLAYLLIARCIYIWHSAAEQRRRIVPFFNAVRWTESNWNAKYTSFACPVSCKLNRLLRGTHHTLSPSSITAGRSLSIIPLANRKPKQIGNMTLLAEVITQEYKNVGLLIPFNETTVLAQQAFTPKKPQATNTRWYCLDCELTQWHPAARCTNAWKTNYWYLRLCYFLCSRGSLPAVIGFCKLQS